MTTAPRSCRLETGVAAAIRRHGEETFPHECCGALIGRDDGVVAAVPLPNTTEEGPRRRFLVRPSDYRMAEQKATDLGLPLANAQIGRASCRERVFRVV